jgi:hypothetical protein
VIRRWLDRLERQARQRSEDRAFEGHFALIRHALIPDPFRRTPGGAV